MLQNNHNNHFVSAPSHFYISALLKSVISHKLLECIVYCAVRRAKNKICENISENTIGCWFSERCQVETIKRDSYFRLYQELVTKVCALLHIP